MYCIKSDLYGRLENTDIIELRLAGIRVFRFKTIRNLVSSIKFRDIRALRDHVNTGPVLYFPDHKILLFDEHACVANAYTEVDAYNTLNALVVELEASGIFRVEAEKKQEKEKKPRKRKKKQESKQ